MCVCQVLEILMAITKLEGPEMKDIRECAQSALDVAAKHGLIRPFDGQAASLEQLRQTPYYKPLTITELNEEEDDKEEEEDKEEGGDDEEETASGGGKEGEGDVNDNGEVEAHKEKGLAAETDGADEVADRLKAASVKDGEQKEGGAEGGDRLKPGAEPDAAKDGGAGSGTKDASSTEKEVQEPVSSSKDANSTEREASEPVSSSKDASSTEKEASEPVSSSKDDPQVPDSN